MSTVGDIMMHVRGYHEYCGGRLVPWGDIMSTMGVFSTMGDIMIHVGDIVMHVGDIMSTMGVFSTMGVS